MTRTDHSTTSLGQGLFFPGEITLSNHNSGVIPVQEPNPIPSWTDWTKIIASVQHPQGSLPLIFKLLWCKWLWGLTVGSFYQDDAKRTCLHWVLSLSFNLLQPRAGESGMSPWLHHRCPQPHFPSFVRPQMSRSLSDSYKHTAASCLGVIWESETLSILQHCNSFI